MTAGEIIREPLDVFGRGSPAERECEVRLVLARVGLSPEALQRYPHEFSGGQRQRIGIARAVILRPQLIVADEAVSALDVSVQAQIVNLMMELRRELGLAFIFISHDLSLVRHVSDRIAIMYLGRIVEMSSREEVFTRPAHPYTQALLASMPQPVVPVTRKRAVLQGEPPAATHLLQGCRFYSRCRRATERCQRETPSLTDVSAGGGVRHEAACFHPGA
jgi:oligopeptide/dipeptide ABC transporter ATP-binding protein